MKLLVNILTTLLFMSCFVTGCKKEEKLTPTKEKENVYGDHTLPQGNHPYDAEIMQLFEKYNTLFLYKYVLNDLYYQIREFTGGVYDPVKDSTTRYGYFDVPADEAYVGQQLDLLKDTWLNYYPEAMLKKALPKKVFLLDSFYFAYNGPGKPIDNWPTFYDTYQGEDFFAVTWGGPRLDAITPAEKYGYKSALNSLFLVTARQKGIIQRSAAFTALTNYAAVTWANHKELGIIDYYNRSPDLDWDVFMKTIVSNSYTTLTDPGGVLHPDVDTKGVIREKYDIVIAYFQSVFGIDLQAIGDSI